MDRILGGVARLSAIGACLLCCVPAFATTRSAPAHHPSSRLDQLFRLDTLDSTREYIDHTLGPAKYATGPLGKDKIFARTYLVAGCTVEIGYQNDLVVYLGLRGVSPQCSFPLSRFVPHLPSVHTSQLGTMTMDQFEQEVGDGIGPNAYFVSCLASCGNSADASIDVLHSGPHVDSFIDILLEQDYPYIDSSTDKAFDDLEKMLIKHETSDYLSMGQVTCDAKYQPLERRLFAASRVKNVFVGTNLETLLSDCHAS